MRYRTIVADPPWKQQGGRLTGGRTFQDVLPGMKTPSKELPYPTMTVDQIAALPVRELADDAAHLYLWTTNRYIEKSYHVARAWGFEPSTMIVWAKTPIGGGMGGAWGVTTEFVLFARRGVLPAIGRNIGTWFEWKRPYEGGHLVHSRKPDAFQDIVEQVSPGPYLELFARRQRLGWDTWGNEAREDVAL